MGVVKANAYGHGAVAVGKTLEAQGIESLAVATPEEGIELREAGIQTPVFVFGGAFHAPASVLLDYKLTPVLYRAEQLESLAKDLNANLPFHLKVDTGMTRLGIFPSEVEGFLRALSAHPRLELAGVFTHLAAADTSFEGDTARQYERFEETEAAVRRLLPGTKMFHIANSAAILGGKLGRSNCARPGIMLYGSNPHPRFAAGKKLRPVMSFETEIVSLKSVPPGTAVSYGGTWVAARPSRIAALPVGYADGYIRHLGNVGEVEIRGKRFPVAGRVCMDLTMVDVTDLSEARVGERVLLWGPGLPAEELAEKAGTISYELYCAVSRRVPRIYREGETR